MRVFVVVVTDIFELFSVERSRWECEVERPGELSLEQ